VGTPRYLNKYLFKEKKYKNISERDALYMCVCVCLRTARARNREWRLWTFVLKVLWYNYSLLVLFFYEEEGLEYNFTLITFNEV
jgi:hypothetical protein